MELKDETSRDDDGQITLEPQLLKIELLFCLRYMFLLLSSERVK
jgi:hypothetical protein